MNHHFRKTHCTKADAALFLLIRFVFREVVRRCVDYVIQEANGMAYCGRQVFPVYIFVFDEF
jgi:hypothetical protein